MSSNHLLRQDAQLTCPHGGKLQLTPGGPRAKVAGVPLLTIANAAAVSGCTSGSPCVTAQWLPAGRVRIGGVAAVLASAGQLAHGVCIGATPQGAPATLSNQTRVTGQ
jgi:hypothetical protein